MFYKIELESLPEFMFCYSVTAENYKNEFRYPADFLEFSVIEEGRISANEDGEDYIIEPHSLLVPTSASNVSLSSASGEKQRHTTVGVRVKYRITEYSYIEKSEQKENVIYLPKVKKLDEKTYDLLLMKIKKIAAYYHSLRKGSSLKALSEWFDLCSGITKITLSDMDNTNKSPSANLYADRVIKYISEHISEKIKIGRMAREMGISEGYLQNTFKRVTGKSIVEYANRYKVKTASELMTVQNMKLKDISSYVGIDDPAYMSRIFKKIMGVSFSEYKNSLSQIKYNSK